MRLRWSHILLQARWEIRSALRDRTIVVNSIVLPLVLYPFLLWAAFNAVAFVRGLTDDMVSRVTVLAEPQAPDITERLAQTDDVVLISQPGGRAASESLVLRGDIDALVLIQSTGPSLFNADISIVFDGTRERSVLAHSRLNAAISRFRDDGLREEALGRGIGEVEWAQFAVERRDTASRTDVGALILGLLLPIVFVVMIALGCMHPAIDSTAGERERGTWETLMTSSAHRPSLVVGKYLAVTVLGGLAGVLNVAAMMLTVRGIVAPLTARSGEAVDFHLPWSAVPVLVLGAVLLAALLAAGMMVLAAFARTFREGQSLVSPFYVATLVPVMFLSTPTIRLTPATALVPVVNIALAVRDAIMGRLQLTDFLLASCVTLAVIALLLRLASLVLSVEQVVVGTYPGTLGRFLRKWRRAQATPEAAS
ncbi:MAG: ABC transporter permease [Vicinamibacterales bacterium]